MITEVVRHLITPNMMTSGIAKKLRSAEFSTKSAKVHAVNLTVIHLRCRIPNQCAILVPQPWTQKDDLLLVAADAGT